MKLHFATIIITGMTLLACSSEESKKAEASKPAETEKKEAVAEQQQVTIKTSMGSIVVELNKEKAPITVANFLSYVEKKHYTNTVFHRVMNGFMIQGGGFEEVKGELIEKATGDGIKNEAKNGLKNDVGTIAMARTGDPDSATAQFFINVANNDALNAPSPDGHGYAVFGKVVKGMDVVEKIKAVATGIKPLTMIHPVSGEKIKQGAENVPNETVVIESITLDKK